VKDNGADIHSGFAATADGVRPPQRSLAVPPHSTTSRKKRIEDTDAWRLSFEAHVFAALLGRARQVFGLTGKDFLLVVAFPRP
jgi:hypothetical protein